MPQIKILDRKFIQKGTVFIEQGTEGNRAYIVQTGKVEVFIYDEKGNTVILAELGPGSIIGEMAVVTNSKRTANVRALEDTVVISLSAHELREYMETSEGVFNRMMRMTSKRLNDTRMALMKKAQKLATIDRAAPITLKTPLDESAEPDLDWLDGNVFSTARKFFPAGTVVIEQGTVGDTAFLIESGRVEVFVTDDVGNQVVVAELGPKEMIGEMAAVSGKPRSASVRAVEDTMVAPVSADELREMMNDSGGLREKMMKMVVARVQDMRHKLSNDEKKE